MGAVENGRYREGQALLHIIKKLDFTTTVRRKSSATDSTGCCGLQRSVAVRKQPGNSNDTSKTRRNGRYIDQAPVLNQANTQAGQVINDQRSMLYQQFSKKQIKYDMKDSFIDSIQETWRQTSMQVVLLFMSSMPMINS